MHLQLHAHQPAACQLLPVGQLGCKLPHRVRPASPLLCSNYMQVKAAQEQQEQYRQYMAEQRRRQQNPFYGARQRCMHPLCCCLRPPANHVRACACHVIPAMASAMA